jgi:hypothetical protein
MIPLSTWGFNEIFAGMVTLFQKGFAYLRNMNYNERIEAYEDFVRDPPRRIGGERW